MFIMTLLLNVVTSYRNCNMIFIEAISYVPNFLDAKFGTELNSNLRIYIGNYVRVNFSVNFMFYQFLLTFMKNGFIKITPKVHF